MWTDKQVAELHDSLVTAFTHLAEKVQKDEATPVELEAFSRIASAVIAD